MTVETSLTRLCACGEVPDDTGKQVILRGRAPVAVFRLGDAFYTMDDQCTHGAALLSEGEVEDCQIYCPFHSGAFDIRTGAATAAPCVLPVRTYKTEVIDGSVYASLDD
jgi:nitrite reductase/ring-hydroxylating ferredoxin subunit